jgi:two-component system, chemotaxis family, CheB/CheR fusion protein
MTRSWRGGSLELEGELEASEEYLRATQEEMQSTNEELRTSIEELQSTNEELQSTNEELETSQEELQSLNEELATVNTELETKVADLSRSQNDMNNLLAGTGIATIFVDQELRIQRFTPTATRLMNLIKADEGRPVGDLASKLASYDSLAADAAGFWRPWSPGSSRSRPTTAGGTSWASGPTGRWRMSSRAPSSPSSRSRS